MGGDQAAFKDSESGKGKEHVTFGEAEFKYDGGLEGRLR